MNKNLVLFIFLMLITSVGYSNTLPDFCNNGSFTCKEISPNYVVAYPINKAQAHEQRRAKQSTETFDKSFADAIEIDLNRLTWQAFDNGGTLVRSGRVSGGKDFCPDIGRKCQTATGTFTIYRKGGENCKSTIFPVGRGGAPMPYCMFFHGGYALHGSYSVPDYNASHGCVRMSPEDAQWLNEEFVQEGLTQVYVHY